MLIMLLLLTPPFKIVECLSLKTTLTPNRRYWQSFIVSLIEIVESYVINESTQ